MQELKARVYSNEEKSSAHQAMLNDPQIKSFNSSIAKIYEMWSHPRRIFIGEAMISDEIPDIPVHVEAVIDSIRKDKEAYIESNYPELSGL